VSVEGPRATRFRYPGEVSGPADEEICSGGSDGRWCWGSSACYRGLAAVSMALAVSPVSYALGVWQAHDGTLDTHFAGLDRKRTRSSRRMEG
jgi:hypothetical protein